MKVKFYGTRGSIPVPGPEFDQFGGNTTCILVTAAGGRIGILDAGSGIRALGNDLLEQGHEQDIIPILLSHTHWDHIQGFPFFKLAFDERRKLQILIHGKDENTRNLKGVFAGQMQDEYFPIPLEAMGAQMNFEQPDLSDYIAPGGRKILASKHSHPGGAYGYRIEGIKNSLVYCTDVEHEDGIDPKVVALSRNADLLIHDAQYTPEELKQKKGWGHSSWEQAVKVAEQACVKKLVLTHHDPEHDDDFITEMEQQCQRRFPDAVFAREKMEIDLD